MLALTSAALAVAGPRSRLLFLVPFWGVLCVSALVAVASPLGAMPLFYLWPVLQAAYFLDRRRLIAVEVTMLVTYAVALQFSPPGLRTAYFLAVVVCTLPGGGGGRPPQAAGRAAGRQPGLRRQHRPLDRACSTGAPSRPSSSAS